MSRRRSGNAPKEKKGYARKVERGLVPHIYDKASRAYAAGAWKNLEPAELIRNRRALGLPVSGVAQ